MKRIIGLLLFTMVLAVLSSSVMAKPLKVYILAGQSNMEGQGAVKQFDYIGDDPATAPMLKEMLGSDGKPYVCEKVWISYNSARTGKLTAGFGADKTKIGPEFTFGIYMHKKLNEPILLIKTAWGGKSLHTDFRPPSGGPYELSSFQKENYPKQQGHGIPKDFEKWKADKIKATGHYYRLMIKHIKDTLKDIKQVCPEYDEKQGYELAGFVWFQGWNDYCDGHTYPDRNKPGGYDLYSELLAHFIGDVRKDLSAPRMPFITGVFGVRGVIDPDKATVNFRKAMAAPAAMAEFKGNVIAVQTAPYWDEALEPIYWKNRKVNSMHGKLHGKDMADFRAKTITPAEEALWKRGGSNGDYHYLGCAKTYAQIGKAFADALVRADEKAKGPVKVFILAGQSNMVGAGLVEFEARRAAGFKKRGMSDEEIAKKKQGTLMSLIKNPEKANIYKHIVDKDGKWVVRDDVWIYYNRDRHGLKKGGLTVGFGSYDDKIGPEFQFGHVLGDYYDEPVLLIKTAWGGKSLAVDFRSPSAGKPTFEIKPDRFGKVREHGEYYRLMMAEVREVLNNFKKHFPDYDGQGYEVVGFCWHQGWNDGCNEVHSQEYGRNMPIFIRDVRKDLGIDDLPFVIANSGFGGRQKRGGVCGRLQKLVQPAQAAAAKKMDNVHCVETRDYYRAPEESPGMGDIEHWYSNAESYFLIGDGMGKAMKQMLINSN